MDILHPLAQQYAEKHSTPQDQLLQELEAYTRSNHVAPHMVSGFLQGRFLQLFSSLLRPQAVLEIGTMTGYSALCLATGLTASGTLHTIELREQDAAIAQFDQATLRSLGRHRLVRPHRDREQGRHQHEGGHANSGEPPPIVSAGQHHRS
ncbi:MAG: O-methyltransferase [Planctomycetaceae bacterium]